MCLELYKTSKLTLVGHFRGRYRCGFKSSFKSSTVLFLQISYICSTCFGVCFFRTAPNIIFFLQMSYFCSTCFWVCLISTVLQISYFWTNIIFLLNVLWMCFISTALKDQQGLPRSSRCPQEVNYSSKDKVRCESFIPIFKLLIAFFRFLSPKCWVKIEIPTLVLQNWGAGKVLCWSEYVRDKQQKLSQGEKKTKQKRHRRCM